MVKVSTTTLLRDSPRRPSGEFSITTKELESTDKQSTTLLLRLPSSEISASRALYCSSKLRCLSSTGHFGCPPQPSLKPCWSNTRDCWGSSGSPCYSRLLFRVPCPWQSCGLHGDIAVYFKMNHSEEPMHQDSSVDYLSILKR